MESKLTHDFSDRGMHALCLNASERFRENLVLILTKRTQSALFSSLLRIT